MAGCKACRHIQRIGIDSDLVNGRSLRSIAATYGLSLGSLHRHKEHVRLELKAAMSARAREGAERAGELLECAQRLLEQSESILRAAVAEQDFRAATAAVTSTAKVLELLARLRGELQSGGVHVSMNGTTNVQVNVNDEADEGDLRELVATSTPTELRTLQQLIERRLISEKPALPSV